MYKYVSVFICIYCMSIYIYTYTCVYLLYIIPNLIHLSWFILINRGQSHFYDSLWLVFEIQVLMLCLSDISVFLQNRPGVSQEYKQAFSVVRQQSRLNTGGDPPVFNLPWLYTHFGTISYSRQFASSTEKVHYSWNCRIRRHWIHVCMWKCHVKIFEI